MKRAQKGVHHPRTQVVGNDQAGGRARFVPVVRSKLRPKPFPRMLVGILLVATLAVVVMAHDGHDDDKDKPGYCDGCFCIPDGSQACPTALEPNMDFSAFVDKLPKFALQNPVTLDCNPYAAAANNQTCDLQPEPLTEGGACVLEFTTPTDSDASFATCPTKYEYAVRTFNGTLSEAQAQGLYVTHAGPCGACSTLQDLYIYMTQSGALSDAATACGFRTYLDPDDGLLCFQEIGFTPGCAATWFYNTLNTKDFCLDICLQMRSNGENANGPAPGCQLHECIACDENNSGPLFVQYGGRTRRNSGLLSSIARSCDELVYLPQVDPCEFLHPPPPTVSPTMAPTESPTTAEPTIVEPTAEPSISSSFSYRLGMASILGLLMQRLVWA